MGRQVTGKQTTRSAPPKAKRQKETEEKQKYPCCRCGAVYEKQMGNFRKVRSPMYKGNGGYVTICDKCLKELYDHYEEHLQSKEEAIRRLCLKLDVYWDEAIYKMTLNGAVRDNPMNPYISKSNLIQVKYESYDDTIDNEKVNHGDIQMPKQEIAKMIENKVTEITQEEVDRWGTGYSKEEYEKLEAHYKMLTGGKKVADFLKEKYVMDLCYIHVQSARALMNGDMKTYSDLLGMYQKVAAAAQIKVEDVDTTNDCYGAWLAEIENHTPAEYYKDKTRYHDFFGIGEYLERFVYRPLKNWVTGSKEKDKEFNLDEESGKNGAE